MKRKHLYIVLGAEAMLCILWCFGRNITPYMASSAFALPFWQVASLLRALSLTGPLGNGAAMALWLGLGLSPLLLLWKLGKKHREDALLGLLSVACLAALWLMANPARLDFGAGPEVAAAAGLTLWSILAAWAVMRTLRYFFASGGEKLLRSAELMLAALSAVLVLSCGAALAGLTDTIAAVGEANTGRPDALSLTYVLLSLHALVGALPYVLDIILVFLGLDLLDALREDSYSEATALAANRLSSFCGKALTIIVLAFAGINILQLIFIGFLASVNITANIPVFSVAFALGALLLCRLIEDRRRLKNDNDLYI